MPDDQLFDNAPPPNDLPPPSAENGSSVVPVAPEPDDMFSGVADRPQIPPTGTTESVPPVGERASRGGGIGRVLLLVGGGAVVLVIIAVVVWLTLFRTGASNAVSPVTNSVAQPMPTPSSSPGSTENIPPASETVGASTESVAPAVPPPTDADGDGLSDADEAIRGTDAARADTDTDGLSDREEVQIYHTDPLNADTDGDTYLDGSEVRKGYDPKGRGKLFEVPRTTGL